MPGVTHFKGRDLPVFKEQPLLLFQNPYLFSLPICCDTHINYRDLICEYIPILIFIMRTKWCYFLSFARKITLDPRLSRDIRTDVDRSYLGQNDSTLNPQNLFYGVSERKEWFKNIEKELFYKEENDKRES